MRTGVVGRREGGCVVLCSTLIARLAEAMAVDGDRDVFVTTSEACEPIGHVYIQEGAFVFIRTASAVTDRPAPAGETPTTQRKSTCQ